MKTEGIKMFKITLGLLITSSLAQIWDQKKGKVCLVHVIWNQKIL